MEWRDVPGYEGLYMVSDEGQVFSNHPKKKGLLKPDYNPKNPRSYPRVRLQRKNVSERIFVHRLVMLAFVGPAPEGFQVNHIDGSKGNPRLENLEYVTMSQNNKHAYTHLGKKPQQGSKHGRSRITEEIALAIRGAHMEGMAGWAIAQKFGVCRGTVSMIINRKIWRHV